MATFEKELATYAQKSRELQVHTGKYVLIKEDAVEGVFDSYSDALKAGYAKFKLEPFLVNQVAPVDSIHHFSRDLAPTCP